MIDTILILIGIIIGARLQEHINPLVDKVLAWAKQKLA